MHIYIIMLIISLFFAYLYMKNSKYENKKSRFLIFTILCSLPFFIISAIRYDVGTDYLYRYVPEFYKLTNGIEVWNYEFGFTLLNKIIICLGGNYEWLFIITSAIIIFPFMYIVLKMSKNPVLSIALFFLCGYFFQSLNILREYMAIILVLCSYPYLLDRKYIKWLFLIFLAFSFHYVSIVALIMPFFVNKNILNLRITTILSIFIIVFKKIIQNIIYYLLGFTKFSVYIGSIFDTSEIKETLIVINIIIYIAMLYCYHKKRQYDNISYEDNFFLSMQALSIITLIAGFVSFLFFRIAFYFTIFQVISIPKYFEDLKIKYKNIKKIKIMFILLLSLTLFYTNILNNNEEVLPYKTIFDKGVK